MRLMSNMLQYNIYHFSDNFYSEILIKMICTTTVLVMLTALTSTTAEMRWRDETVLNVVELNVIQLHCDVMGVARSLLNESSLGSHLLHP